MVLSEFLCRLTVNEGQASIGDNGGRIRHDDSQHPEHPPGHRTRFANVPVFRRLFVARRLVAAISMDQIKRKI